MRKENACTHGPVWCCLAEVESSWNVVAHGDARVGEVKGKLANGVGSHYSHTTSEYGLSSITSPDAHTSAAGGRLNWRPCRFKWTRPFRQKMKCGFCACAITFRTQSSWLNALWRTRNGEANWMQETLKFFYYKAVLLSGSEMGESGAWKHFLVIANIVPKFEGSKLIQQNTFHVNCTLYTAT